MYYLGGRYNFPNGETKLGLEFNHGSKYWFNFALAEDDFLAPKTSTRGDVWEVYLTHRIRDRFVIKLDYMYYDYDYSGSGWLLGAAARRGRSQYSRDSGLRRRQQGHGEPPRRGSEEALMSTRSGIPVCPSC